MHRIDGRRETRHMLIVKKMQNSSLNYAYTPLLNADPIIRMKDQSEREQAQKDDAEEDQADGLKSNSHRRKKVQ